MDIERAKFNPSDGFKNPQEIASTQELSREKHLVSWVPPYGETNPQEPIAEGVAPSILFAIENRGLSIMESLTATIHAQFNGS